MLVLSRCEQESIMIGDDIKIMVVHIRGGMVKLGIEAPRSVAVHREEVWKRIQEGKKEDSNG